MIRCCYTLWLTYESNSCWSNVRFIMGWTQHYFLERFAIFLQFYSSISLSQISLWFHFHRFCVPEEQRYEFRSVKLLLFHLLNPLLCLIVLFRIIWNCIENKDMRLCFFTFVKWFWLSLSHLLQWFLNVAFSFLNKIIFTNSL